MKQSLEDVAKLAGVSTATVSRALRDLESVKPETKQRIRKIAAELGYVTSPFATTLATGLTRTVGILTPWVNRWFFSNVIEGAERTLRASGMDALLYTFWETDTQQRPRLDLNVLRRRVDAVLVLGLPLRASEVQDLESLGVPLVFVGTGHTKHLTVRVDDALVARLAMDHLIGLGHRNIGHLSGRIEKALSWSPPRVRRDAWRRALEDIGLEPRNSWCANGDFKRAMGRQATADLLDRAPELTAIFCSSDDMAIGAFEEIRHRGLIPGQDISVVGVDGTETGELLGVTTIAQDPVAQGEAAARCLLSHLAGQETAGEVLGDLTLIPRISTGPPVL
ncbi:LacI family DNA-binding transcriptional regulator [Jonesiaceae bacterium BS-20]|uniref:LacI family DNA-binding transcriptional regulator n=1 Tax=Jonesiaceae bacterium BS-20 TaxID=3120821 RepID=A0AAU7DWD2_9MICO